MALKKMTLMLRVEVPLDESMLDVAGFRSLWEEIDGLADTCRGFGELTHFSVEDLPDKIVLADTRGPSNIDLVRRAMEEGSLEKVYGPAVTDRCRGHANPEFDYPESFGDRVPKTIRLTRGVRSDTLCGVGADLRAERGELYPAWTNRHGAVSAVLPDGHKLGVKPGEFEVEEWLDV